MNGHIQKGKLKKWHYNGSAKPNMVYLGLVSVCGRRGICTSNLKLVDCKKCVKILDTAPTKGI